MKTLRINYIFARASMAGGVKSGRLMAEALVRRGHDVRIVYGDPPPVPPRPWRLRRRRQFARTQRELEGRQRHHLEQSTAALVRVPRKRIVAEDVPPADFSIANFWTARESLVGWPADRGIPGLYVRGHFPQFGNGERMAQAYRKPGVLITHAVWLRRMLMEDHGAVAVALAPNGIDRSQFDAGPRERNDIPRIGFQYGSAPRKGPDTMLDAFRLLREGGTSAQLVAFGSTPLTHEAPADFEYHLRPPQDRIADIYRSCDVWIVPSRAEGLPMPGLEGAACRCPIVATRCGGPEDYVTEGESGHLVPVADPQALAAAIRQVITASLPAWKAMSERSYAESKRFDWDANAEVLEAHLIGTLEGSIPLNPDRS